MENNISTEVGKIFCKYNEETDDFDKRRVTNVEKSDDTIIYNLSSLDKNFRIIKEDAISFTQEDFNNMKKDWDYLKSDGIISLTNVVAVENELRQIKDVVGIFFPNNSVTGYPNINQPFVVARQCLNNIFDITGETVGMSVSLDTLPAGYALSDFMENASVISSKLAHVYKTDTPHEMSIVLDNEDSSSIIKDLYDHEVQYRKNSVIGFEDKFNESPEKYKCLNGYNIDIEGFIENTEFFNDILHITGISIVDFAMEANKPLSIDDKLLLSVIHGGIKIDKAVPLKFGYDINLAGIKMNYFLVEDSNRDLWIVPYTTSPDEIDATDLYNLTEERTSQLQERLLKCVKAYSEKDDSQNVQKMDE